MLKVSRVFYLDNEMDDYCKQAALEHGVSKSYIIERLLKFLQHDKINLLHFWSRKAKPQEL